MLRCVLGVLVRLLLLVTFLPLTLTTIRGGLVEDACGRRSLMGVQQAGDIALVEAGCIVDAQARAAVDEVPPDGTQAGQLKGDGHVELRARRVGRRRRVARLRVHLDGGLEGWHLSHRQRQRH